MSLPSILAYVDPINGKAALRLAARASARLDALVTALVVRPEAAEVVPMLGEGATGAAVDDILARAEADAEAALALAKHELADWTGVGEAALVAETGRVADIAARHARLHGLTVVGTGEDGPGAPDVVDACLFESGRPLLLAPAAAATEFAQRIAIFWNDSPEAAKALWAAYPLLRDAETLQIISIDDGDDAQASLDRVHESLKRTGVATETRLLPPDGDEDTDAQLAKAAADMQADLVVMGAYTHSRIREVILGGVTRTMLREQNRAVLLAH